MKKVVLVLAASFVLSAACLAQKQDVSKLPGLLNEGTGSIGLCQQPMNGTGLLVSLPPQFNYQLPPDPSQGNLSFKNPHLAPATGSSTSEGAFPKGTFAINLGVGFGNVYWGTEYGTSSGVSPTLILEYAITDKLGIGNIAVGLIVSYASTKYSDMYNSYTYSGLLIGARGEYHFILNNDKIGTKLDPYAGIMLGYIINNNPDVSDTYDVLTGKSSGFQPGVFAGAHYFFGPHFGVYAEFGYEALFVFNIGISFKF
jgi:Outer membrane protein beta-barrel domain